MYPLARCNSTNPFGLLYPGVLAAGVLAAGVLAACSGPEPRFEVEATIQVVDEAGVPIAAAIVALESLELRADGNGVVSLPRSAGPMLAVVSADGYLAEPVIVGREDDRRRIRVKLWSAQGGARWTMHAGGDVMFGRRYNDPKSGEPLIPLVNVSSGAEQVVAALRRAFVAADVRIFNLETVVSELPDSAAYPGKRFILNSLPDTIAGVKALEPTLVDLANNHARDYLDEGVRRSTAVLDEAGVPWFGASDGTYSAEAPARIDVAGLRVAMLAWTTVNGSFVNDNYPRAEAAVPEGISDGERWQYERRSWGFSGVKWSAPVADRRIGEAWRLFSEAEDAMSADDVAAAWTSLYAVYPELQDWVARRGHGGAAGWDSDRSPEIVRAAAEDADMVVVQLHAGFQFQQAPSSFVRSIARKAIDAGATIVICHHPHVLQGVEWYRGALIVYSLGNFVFDQDFFLTFPTGFLRTVWQGAQLLEARFVPLEIVGYRPMPAADQAGRRTLRRLWEMSLMDAESRRVDGSVRVFVSEPDSDSQTAHIRMERGTGVVSKVAPATQTVTLDVGPGDIEPIEFPGLIDPRLGMTAGAAPGLLIGRDLLGWGQFEDALADDAVTNGAHWALAGTRKKVVVDASAAVGVGFLRLTRFATNESSVLARPVARTVIPEHRLWTDSGGTTTPLDPVPSYSVTLRARLKGSGAPAVRIDLFDFDDTNPTEDPSSTAIGQVSLPIDVKADGRWHDVVVELDSELLSDAGRRANMMLVYVKLGVPEDAESNFDVDALRVMEWRRADAMPNRLGDYSAVRNRGDVGYLVELSGLPDSGL